MPKLGAGGSCQVLSISNRNYFVSAAWIIDPPHPQIRIVDLKKFALSLSRKINIWVPEFSSRYFSTALQFFVHEISRIAWNEARLRDMTVFENSMVINYEKSFGIGVQSWAYYWRQDRILTRSTKKHKSKILGQQYKQHKKKFASTSDNKQTTVTHFGENKKTAPWEFPTKLIHYLITSNNKSNLHSMIIFQKDA